ncbi:MAG: putative bifunctional diguanylate cyclase/phosphodiesterase [Solirubrobacteraceae bacterium]
MRGRLLGVSGGRVATVVMAVVVVVAMVVVADLAARSADLHRRAQVVVEQIRVSGEEMSAFKWMANTEVLEGTADFSLDGPLVREGAGITTQLDAEVAQLGKLAPGSATARLHTDIKRLFSSELQELSIARGPRTTASLAAMQARFEPIIDRLDSDAQQAAQQQQAVASGAVQRLLLGSIGSLLLGVLALVGLIVRQGRVQRRSVLAEQVRAVERRSEQRIRALVERSSDVVTVLGRDLHVRWQAASVERLLGVQPGSLLEAAITSIVHPDDAELFEDFLLASLEGRGPSTLHARLHHADGGWCEVETVAENRFDDPAVEGLVLNMRDISERKAIEDELRHQAFHDNLTGLANRALFEDRLRHALAGNLRGQCSLAVLFLDLDDFKTINDSLGHRAGDELLKLVAARIDELVRPTDTAARLGGDEFAVLAAGVTSIDAAREIAERVLQTLSLPFMIDERELNVTASVGIALSDGSVHADELLRNADMAMYAAKAGGKNAIHAFEQRMHRRAVKRLELRNELQRALANREFELDYQPIVSLQSRRIAGAEALVRWRHPTRGRLAPDQFIALAEETGLIVPLGAWVLEQACTQVCAWETALHQAQRLYISVNVSVRQLHEDDFPDLVATVLARTGLAPESLVLEITEGLLADDSETIVRRLEKLKHLGLRIAVDDFGTGYSGLSHLQRFPIDILKIDKSFIDDLHNDHQKTSLVQGIINLSESLQLDVIAEGIEQTEQADQLRSINATLGQGFLYSKPISPDALLTLLRDGHALNALALP